MKKVPGSPFRPSDPLRDPRRVADVVYLIPPSHTVKGMFIQPLVERLGRERFDAVRSDLEDPPRGDGYLPFADYPQADHTRIQLAVTAVEQAEARDAEALRRFARHDMETLAGSTFGRVILAMVGDARTALLRVPAVYARVAKAPDQKIEAVALPDGRVQLDFQPLYGLYGYQLGQIEGIVAHYGAESCTEILEGDGYHFRFLVEIR